ncbi:MAG TPA: hypothetical protein VFO54_05515, partial [Chryseosolibacter sp.]|nr:hypothetical protein [Chryseosolibacter sp.]
IRLLLFLSIVSCANDDLENSATRAAFAAATLCQKPAHDMVWLETLLKQSQSDATLHGDMFAVSVDGNIVFIHQLTIMSCLGCVLYDCDGNRIDLSSIDHKKVVEGMHPENRIYSAFESK